MSHSPAPEVSQGPSGHQAWFWISEEGLLTPGGLWARRCLPGCSPAWAETTASVPQLASPPLVTPRPGAQELGTAAHHGGPAAGCSPATALGQRARAAPVQEHPAQVCCLLGASCSPGPCPQGLKVSPQRPERAKALSQASATDPPERCLPPGTPLSAEWHQEPRESSGGILFPPVRPPGQLQD